MKKIIIPVISALVFFSCKDNKNTPDVSAIKVNLETRRFEQDFFAMDTNHVAESMANVLKKYPDFLPDFTQNILGLDLDSLLVPGNREDVAIRMFIHDYMPMKDSADLMYKDFSKQTEAIKKGLQYVKYYFPQYKIPGSIITFIGPINANFQTSFGIQGDVLTTTSFGIGLQLHMGQYFSFYRSPEGLEQYPDYISGNFDAAHIPVNCMKNIVDDMFADRSNGKALIEQMVEKGKRIYLLSRFLPNTPEYLCIGYTSQQMKDAYANEAVIWNLFLNNNLLNQSDPDMVKNYVGESPKTQELGEGAPGNIGTFSGLQVVKKYMEKFPETTLEELMKTDARDIYNKSKYKPRA
jgi:hypothetical protein